MDDQSEIIEKIRKLLALAERGGTETEGDAAMRKVQELLTKHNLDIDAIKDKGEATFSREYREFEWNASWIRVAYAGIARLYFCHMYYQPKGRECQQIYLVGKSVNIITAQYVADVVISTGKKLAKLYAQNAYAEFGMNPVSASNGFKKGYAARIQHLCNEMIREAATVDKVPGQALVVADFYKRNLTEILHFETNVLGLRLSRGAGMATGDHGHMGAGASAADGVNLRSSGIASRGEQTYRIGSK